MYTVSERGLPALKKPGNIERLLARDIAAKTEINERIASPIAKRKVTGSAAENVTGVFSVFCDWSRGDTCAATNGNEQPAAHEEKFHDRWSAAVVAVLSDGFSSAVIGSVLDRIVEGGS
jgi:hypothetical protein